MGGKTAMVWRRSGEQKRHSSALDVCGLGVREWLRSTHPRHVAHLLTILVPTPPKRNVKTEKERQLPWSDSETPLTGVSMAPWVF